MLLSTIEDQVGYFEFAALSAKILAMMRAYLDDSGTDGGPHCFVAGYAASQERWKAFCGDWQELRVRHLGGKPFKMVRANRQKDSGHIPIPGIVEFARCVVRHAEVELWSAAPEYEVAKIVESYGLRFDKYWLCFAGLINETVYDYELRQRGEPLGWTFDHQGRGKRDQQSELEVSLIRAFYDLRGRIGPERRHLLSGISFDDDELLNPLQAADLLAWQKRRFHSEPFDAEAHEAYQVLSQAKLHRVGVVWFRHKIEDLIELATSPGGNVEQT
jgi:hypothetical protein